MAAEVARLPGAAQSRTRKTTTTVLLYLAYALGFIAVAIQISILLAGSQLVNTDRDKPGPMRLLFSNLAIASFDGIIPASQNDTYLLTMHLFLNSFGWEYPSAQTKAHTAGIVTPTYDNALYLPRDFVPIGKAIDLPSASWGCFPPNWTGTCDNPFFAAFRRQWPYDSAPGQWTRFLYIYVFICAALVYGVEVLIVVRPHWLKCRCYFGWLKRFCPCPKGERHEIERLPAAFWDRYRMWMWPTIPVSCALAVFDPYWRGRMMLSWLAWAPDGDTSAMKPRMGTAFVALGWTAAGAGLAASLCVLARLLITRRANWMEQQGALPAVEGDASVGLDNARAAEDGRPKAYTDAEPDAPVASAVPAALT